MTRLVLEAFDVVVVPFPFTDRQTSKRRPSLVLSSAAFNNAAQHSVLAMITSAEQSAWPGDIPITELGEAGLTSACLIRLKLFTLDHRLIIKRTGKLGANDRHELASRWKSLIFQ